MRHGAGRPTCLKSVSFATKPQLARQLIERVREAGLPCAWVVADSVYGADHKLRFFLEERQQPYVMAVTSAQSVWTGLSQRRVKSLVALAPAEACRRDDCLARKLPMMLGISIPMLT